MTRRDRILLESYDGNRRVRVTEDGQTLRCSCRLFKDGDFAGDYQPCPHIREAMVDRLDANLEEPLTNLVLVPMKFRFRPGDRGWGTPVAVDRSHDRHGLVPVRVASMGGPLVEHELVPVRVASMGPAEGPIVGFLDTHEARWEIRMMLLEFLRGQYHGDDLPTCKGENHRRYIFSEEERAEKDLDGTSMDVLENVGVLISSGKCITCLRGDDEVDDLIPDI